MRAELVYDGSEVHIPSTWDKPRPDQMQGSPSEQLMEVCGRGCYDSMGTGRGSGDYHRNLLFDQKHYSVAEHVHFTFSCKLDPIIWLGVPDISVTQEAGGYYRLTCNLRHVLEWPHNLTFDYEPTGTHKLVADWGNALKQVANELCPDVFPIVSDWTSYTLCTPERDTEAFVSLFLEDSRVWSHEMVRHRGNMSQRSGRFVDETDRKSCMHPLLRDYFNEVGFLKNNPPPDPEDPEYQTKLQAFKKERQDSIRKALAEGRPPRRKGESDEPLFEGGILDYEESERRGRLGDAVGSLQAQSRIVYRNVVERLQVYAQASRKLDPRAARKQARSAARYYLGNGLSTEMVFTASIRHWRHIFEMRCSPHADDAIRELMEQARTLVKESRYGHLL